MKGGLEMKFYISLSFYLSLVFIFDKFRTVPG